MIPADLAARLRFLHEASLFETSPPVAGLQRTRELQSQLQELVPGRRFFATLQRTLPDGTFRALVAGQQITLSLNASAKPGDTLELVATSVTPRMVLARPVGAESAAARPTLSPTGQLISFLLTGQPAAAPATLANNQPLFSAAPANAGASHAGASAGGNAADVGAGTGVNTNTGAVTSAGAASAGAGAHIAASTQLAPLLRQALVQSGLFYEAHQAQWLAGKIDLAALLREPQARQALPGQAAAGGAGASPAASSGAGATTALSSPAAAMEQATASVAASRTEGAVSRVGAVAREAAREEEPPALRAGPERAAENALRVGPVAERLLPIVHQQLEALASQQYVWHGMAWPGQAFEWIIEDPRGEGHGEEGKSGEGWNTTLRLSLPRLGGIEAHVHLNAGGVALRLQVGDTASAAVLETRCDELAEALAAAGVPLTGIAVEHRNER